MSAGPPPLESTAHSPPWQETQRAGGKAKTPRGVLDRTGMQRGPKHRRGGFRTSVLIRREVPSRVQLALLGAWLQQRALIAFAKAFPAQEEDLGVFHQAVRDRGGDGGVVEDVAPF